MKKGVGAAGAKVKFIAPKIGELKLSDGLLLKIDGQLVGTPSVMFDAIAIILSDAGATVLGKKAAAINFVHDAFGHLKAIGIDQGAEPLSKMAGVEKDDGVIAINAMDRSMASAKTRQWDREASVRILA